jgi:hypothetical protein
MFDLEQGIQEWRKALNKNCALEDGYKEELENHLRDKIDFLLGRGLSEREAFEEAVLKIGEAGLIGEDYFKTDTRHASGRPPWRKGRWIPPVFSGWLCTGSLLSENTGL